ncbi:MAG: DUF1957 domain-containing protein [Frankia sp.]|nr:DUF1957 domain-containing protein [Frankia sp.]
MTTAHNDDVVGTCCIVLHTHLPWVAHAGAWPVGEEWLHQAWSGSYLPIVAMLDRLATEGRRDLLTIGVTPVLAAMLDDPYCLREFHTWLGTWQTRAGLLWSQHAVGADAAPMRELAAYEHGLAERALADYERHWRHGGSPVLRRLSDAGVVEILGGPATHAFQPSLDDRLVAAGLRIGQDDAVFRRGSRPTGLWAPECGYRPGLEDHYADAGVTHFVVDGPTLLAAVESPAATGLMHYVGSSDVVAFARDLDVTYRVWSPRSGYPAGRWYRDFHTFDHATGMRTARVTSTRTPPAEKHPYEPAAVAGAVARDARDFVDTVRRRLAAVRAETGDGGVVVVAYDTELFGHWWHEGPAWLEAVLRLLPGAGVRISTLRSHLDRADPARADLGPGSWGSGKDARVWTGDAVSDVVAESSALAQRTFEIVDKTLRPGAARSLAADQMVREALLALSSDWAFCITKDVAAEYARRRFTEHAARFTALADAIAAAHDGTATSLAARWREVDGVFGHVDARLLSRTGG